MPIWVTSSRLFRIECKTLSGTRPLCEAHPHEGPGPHGGDRKLHPTHKANAQRCGGVPGPELVFRRT
jgi:hypothetical protein